MQCFSCSNPAASPSTGAWLGPRTVACRECTIAFWKWFRARMGNKPGQANFYEAAGKHHDEKNAATPRGMTA